MPRLFKQLSILNDTAKAAIRSRPPPKKDFDAKLPRVDVFVTYCGEGTDLVLNTAKAACAQDFPSQLLRVIVLDDSGSNELKSAISALRNSSKHPNLYYASRKIQVSTHSKDANLNFGLSFASTLPGPNPDYLSVLDVDMIPSPQWLRTVLACLVSQPTAGMVCAVQYFYNTLSSDPLCMTHELVHMESLNYLQNAAQDAWCTGSGFVVRRAALEQIGGFPEGHLQEDILTSLLFSAVGWGTVLAPGPLQWGLAADTMASWLKQRQRWAAGVINICRFAFSRQARGMPATVRLRGLLWGAVDTYTSAVWTLCMIVLPLAVMTGKPLLPDHQLRFQLHLALFDFVAQSMCYYFLSSTFIFRMSILDHHLFVIWTAPLRLAVACRYILPMILGRPLPGFSPTGIPATGNLERAARMKGTSFLRVVLWDYLGWIHALCLGACFAGAGVSMSDAVRVFGRAMCEEEDVRLSLQTAFDAFIVRVGWPPLFLLLTALIKNAWTPIAYGISPPPLVHRNEMLYESEDTGVQYPTEKAKRDYIKTVSQRFWWSIAVFYLVVMVVAEVSHWNV